MKHLTVLYDAECEMCLRCRTFLSRQPAYLPLIFVPLQTLDLEERFPGIAALQPDREIIVISDEGNVYQGGAGWIMCLYALRAYREWSFRLASPLLLPLAQRIVSNISKNRHYLSKFLAAKEKDIAAAATLYEEESCGC